MLSQGRQNFFWPLRLIVAMSLAVPALLFAFASWQNWRSVQVQTDERVVRALDVLQEHALKALQTVEVSLSETNEVLGGLSDADIRQREEQLHRRLRQAQDVTKQMESIWAFDKDGHPLVSSTIYPVPQSLNNSDRSYFAAQKNGDRGTFLGEVMKARVGSAWFFVVSSRRRSEVPGVFNGVVAITLQPAHFIEFYQKLSRGRDSFALVRADGTLLARYPDTNLDRIITANRLVGAFQSNPESGLFTAISSLDQVERRVGYRKVPGYPLYVTSSVETAAAWAEFLYDMLIYLAVGLPATLALFALALFGLRRAQQFQAEVARRETAEAALKQAQRLEALGQLTGGVAHDFNNLLMVVSGNAEMLRRSLPRDAKSIRALAGLETVVKRGIGLTRALLSFSRQQAHETRSIDLAGHIAGLQSVLRSSVRGDIALDVDMPVGLWPIKIDQGELELALLNLAVNARDAMTGGGTLSFVARNESFQKPNDLDLEGDFVALTVRDTGAGIPTDVLSRVFEPFFTTKQVGKGTGLGLSQVYGFARQAGGLATIESSIGRGTAVTLYLPRSLEPPEAAPPVEVAGPPAPAAAALQVLLVEDNAEVAQTASALLDELGYRVEHAPDAAAARKALLAAPQRFDLVLSDVVMPGTENGLDLARWIKREYGDGLPVVLASGYSDQAADAAAEGFTLLRKPYGLSRLESALADVRRGATGRQVA